MGAPRQWGPGARGDSQGLGVSARILGARFFCFVVGEGGIVVGEWWSARPPPPSPKVVCVMDFESVLESAVFFRDGGFAIPVDEVKEIVDALESVLDQLRIAEEEISDMHWGGEWDRDGDYLSEAGVAFDR